MASMDNDDRPDASAAQAWFELSEAERSAIAAATANVMPRVDRQAITLDGCMHASPSVFIHPVVLGPAAGNAHWRRCATSVNESVGYLIRSASESTERDRASHVRRAVIDLLDRADGALGLLAHLHSVDTTDPSTGADPLGPVRRWVGLPRLAYPAKPT